MSAVSPGDSVREVLEAARRRLAGAPFEPSTREATLLLAHVLGVAEASLLAHGERIAPPEPLNRFRELLARRLEGEPIAYLLGRREFYGRRFLTDRRVLIPRPETEHLIETALDLRLPDEPTILDVGTGTGCIGLTLALEIHGARVVATDRSPAALAVADANRRALAPAASVRLVAADLTTALALERFDLVVSNPPYVAPRELPALSPEIRDFEPPLALLSGGDGTSVAEHLVKDLETSRQGTTVLLEIGAGQTGAVERIAKRHGFVVRGFRSDYGGIPRVAHLERR